LRRTAEQELSSEREQRSPKGVEGKSSNLPSWGGGNKLPMRGNPKNIAASTTMVYEDKGSQRGKKKLKRGMGTSWDLKVGRGGRLRLRPAGAEVYEGRCQRRT